MDQNWYSRLKQLIFPAQTTDIPDSNTPHTININKIFKQDKNSTTYLLGSRSGIRVIEWNIYIEQQLDQTVYLEGYDFLFYKTLKTGTESQQASCSMGVGGHFPMSTRPGRGAYRLSPSS